jgi:cell division septum initiation protein DivIVA
MLNKIIEEIENLKDAINDLRKEIAELKEGCSGERHCL